MADGRKYEEVKVIKNPLLQQNILAEEITGLSFIVPAVAEKPKLQDNGSCQGLEVSQIGVKAEGSDGKPLDTQTFTDIPLDVPESSEECKPQESPQPPDKQEGSTKSFGLRSILPSFVPLLGSQPLKSHAPKDSEAKTSPVECQLVESAPEAVAQQLTPVLADTITAIPSSIPNETHTLQQNAPAAPPIYDSAIENLKNYAYHSPTPFAPPVSLVTTLSKSCSAPVQSPLSTTPALSSGTAQPLAVLPPPLAPPPTSSNINQIGNTNPYALKRHPSITSTTRRPTLETSYFTPSFNSSLYPSNTSSDTSSQISSISTSSIATSVSNILTSVTLNTSGQPSGTSASSMFPSYSSNNLPTMALKVSGIPVSSAVESHSNSIVRTSNDNSPLNDTSTSGSNQSTNLEDYASTLNTELKLSPTAKQIMKRIETPETTVSQSTSATAEDVSAITTIPSSTQTPTPARQPSVTPTINDTSEGNSKSYTYNSPSPTLTPLPSLTTNPQLFSSPVELKLSSTQGPLSSHPFHQQPSYSPSAFLPPTLNRNTSSGNPYSLNNSSISNLAPALPSAPPLDNTYFVPSQFSSSSSYTSTSPHLPVFSNSSLYLEQSTCEKSLITHKKEVEVSPVVSSTPSSLPIISSTSSPHTCTLFTNLSTSLSSVHSTTTTNLLTSVNREYKDPESDQYPIYPTSSPPSSLGSLYPPPISTVNKVGNTNPYTLKRSHYTSASNFGTNTNSGVMYFPNQNSTSNNYNIFSGPQITATSVISTFPPAAENYIVSPSSESHNFEAQFGRAQAVPLIQSFTSALTNFISPQKQPRDFDSAVNDSSTIEAKKSTDFQPAAIQIDNSPASNIDNNLQYSASNSQQTGPPYQTETMQNQLGSDSNNTAPSIPLFNASNLIHNNESNPTHTVPTISNEIVCIPSIRTTLNSADTSRMNYFLEANTVTSNSTKNPQLFQSESKIISTYGINQHLDVESINSNLFNNNIIDNQISDSNSFTEQSNIINNNQLPTDTSQSMCGQVENKTLENTSPLDSFSLVENQNKLNLNCTVPDAAQTFPSNIPINAFIQTSEPERKENFLPVDNSCVDPSNSVPVVQPISAFNYFTQQEENCTPSSFDEQPAQSKQPPQLPTSSFFKPIEGPVFSNTSLSTQNSSEKQPVLTFTYPIQTPSGKISSHPTNPPQSGKITFPPPNISCPPKASVVTKTVEKIKNPLKIVEKEENKLDFEELDQIPLEGSVPLYNPDYIINKNKIKGEIPDTSNTYRLSSRGLKKPAYAPVPELGVTERKNYSEATSPSNISISSQEEMAAIEAQSHRGSRVSPTQNQGKTSPSNSTTLETYYTNLMQPSYRPPYYHWFYKSGQHKSSPWVPFSMADSLNLEQIYTSSEISEDTKVPTDGGRYDVEIIRRRKTSVYWEEPPGEVRRCAWFVKSPTDSRFVPYDENIAALLEDEYKNGFETNEWNRRIELADGEVIILHSPTAMAHHVRSSSPDAWGTQPTLQLKPRVVKRGVEDFSIPKGEPKQVDHLLLMVHGVGKACDLRFRSLVEVVDDFRNIAQQLVGSHFHSGVENGNVGRVEILPVEWHGALHTESINDRLSAITLPSIPRAREFTNETLLDILFYTSPVFAEKIVQAVGDELNRVYSLYKARNPGFRGEVSLGGHSLGSLILFDILCNQKVRRPVLSTQESLQSEENEDVDELGCLQRTKAKLSRRMSYLTIGPGTGQPYTIYPQLQFLPKSFFALGSPIGMFVTVRGLESLGEDFKFPTCPAFFNIFHPNDPVAYRIEPLIKPELATVPAVLIPHHKGRKRMHLELKETMAHVTAALKQKLVDSMKTTWSALYHLASFSRKDNALQGDVNKVIEDEVLRDLENDPSISVVGEEGAGSDVKVGKLNGGRRVDYVLQEAPLETFNQYISAIRSHLVYWESHDTTLMVLKEIYGSMGISPDSQVPQPILPFDLGAEGDTYSDFSYSIGAPPTQFVRK